MKRAENPHLSGNRHIILFSDWLLTSPPALPDALRVQNLSGSTSQNINLLSSASMEGIDYLLHGVGNKFEIGRLLQVF